MHANFKQYIIYQYPETKTPRRELGTYYFMPKEMWTQRQLGQHEFDKVLFHITEEGPH